MSKAENIQQGRAKLFDTLLERWAYWRGKGLKSSEENNFAFHTGELSLAAHECDEEVVFDGMRKALNHLKKFPPPPLDDRSNQPTTPKTWAEKVRASNKVRQ